MHASAATHGCYRRLLNLAIIHAADRIISEYGVVEATAVYDVAECYFSRLLLTWLGMRVAGAVFFPAVAHQQ